MGSVCLHCLSPAQLSSIQFTSALFCSVQIDRKRSEERQPHAVPRPARTCPRRCCTALRLQQMESPAPPSKTQKQERLKVERVREKENESHSNWKSADVPSGGWRARSCHAHASWPGVLAKVRGMVPCWVPCTSPRRSCPCAGARSARATHGVSLSGGLGATGFAARGLRGTSPWSVLSECFYLQAWRFLPPDAFVFRTSLLSRLGRRSTVSAA